MLHKKMKLSYLSLSLRSFSSIAANSVDAVRPERPSLHSLNSAKTDIYATRRKPIIELLLWPHDSSYVLWRHQKDQKKHLPHQAAAAASVRRIVLATGVGAAAVVGTHQS